MTKIVVDRDGLNNPDDSFGAQPRDASSDDGMTIGQVAAQLIIERAYPLTDLIRGWPRLGNGLMEIVVLGLDSQCTLFQFQFEPKDPGGLSALLIEQLMHFALTRSKRATQSSTAAEAKVGSLRGKGHGATAKPSSRPTPLYRPPANQGSRMRKNRSPNLIRRN
jgi:hypothetical protein